jgi:hypothetical protein
MGTLHKTYVYLRNFLSEFFLERVIQAEVVQKIKTHFIEITLFFRAVYEMWKCMVQADRTHMKI